MSDVGESSFADKVERKVRKKMESNPVVDEGGNKFWYNEKGELHRDGDEPAVICSNGNKWWYKEGKHHRIYGAAVEYSKGYKEWWYENEYFECTSQKEFLKILSERGIVPSVKNTTSINKFANE